MYSDYQFLTREAKATIAYINENPDIFRLRSNGYKFPFQKLIDFLQENNFSCEEKYFFYLAGRLQIQGNNFELPLEVIYWKQEEYDELMNGSVARTSYREQGGNNIQGKNESQESPGDARRRFHEERKKELWKNVIDLINGTKWPSDEDRYKDFDPFEGNGNWGHWGDNE